MRSSLTASLIAFATLLCVSMRQDTRPASSGRIAGPASVSIQVECGKNTVRWQAVDGAFAYQVARGAKSDGSDSKVLGEVKAPTVEFIDNAVVPGRAYYFVRAIGDSTSAFDESRAAPDAAPANLAVEVDWQTKTAVVSWERVPNVIGYTLYYQKCSGTWDVAVAKQTLEKSIKLTDITPQRWRFWVVANNDCGEGPTSSAITTEPENNPVPCRRP